LFILHTCRLLIHPQWAQTIIKTQGLSQHLQHYNAALEFRNIYTFT
jgi:hypothetical protein